MASKDRIRKSAGIILSLLVMLAYLSPQARAVRDLPSTLTVRTGELHSVALGWPFTLSTQEGEMQVLASADESLQVVGKQVGNAALTISAFGLPVKTMEVDIKPERMLIPGGASIGAALNTKGVLVVGTSELSGAVDSPARLAGLREGDLILSIDGQEVQSASHLTELISLHGAGPVKIQFSRGGTSRDAVLSPVEDQLDGRLRLGLWVRDATAGVGTLSFYDPSTGRFGALGHAISDVDTGVILPVREGNILESKVVGIRKGLRGTPGELQGSFLRDQLVLGDIRINNNFGIFGTAAKPLANPLFPAGLPVASQQNVHTGPATILTTLDDGGIKAYQVEITRVARQPAEAQKSLTLKVTDPELLERTGGIVQGMSGSPILQDGRIVGAVTHVFVNDPTQGYGVFIEWMLAQADRIA